MPHCALFGLGPCSRRRQYCGMDPLRRVRRTQKRALAAKLRRSATQMERHAWSLLRDRGILGFKFRRQHVLRGFIVDFYCAAQRLVLELEGDAHDGPDSEHTTLHARRCSKPPASEWSACGTGTSPGLRSRLSCGTVFKSSLIDTPFVVPPLRVCGEGDRG